MKARLFLILAHLELVFINSENIAFPCETPDGEHSYCVSLFSCPHLIESLSTVDSDAIDYVKQSICLGCEAGDFMVCCGTPKKFTVKTSTLPKIIVSVPPEVDALKNETKEARREYVRTKLLPSQIICGQQHTDDRFYDRNETAVDEFPWIVQLENTSYFEYYSIMCNGVLISNRYVLTSSYCGEDTDLVRLGQHSNHKNVTCVQESSLFVECTDPVVRRNVEKRIVIGEVCDNYYTPYHLMLIRLNESVKFSEYIRPICLPIDGSQRLTSENYLTFSGFGAEDDEDEVLKKRITYNLTNSQVCYDAADGLKETLELTDSTLACLVPPPGNTLAPCWGEHGAPLMYKYKYKWFADAIFIDVLGHLSDTVSLCNATVPIAGIFITPTIMNWILDNIED